MKNKQEAMIAAAKDERREEKTVASISEQGPAWEVAYGDGWGGIVEDEFGGCQKPRAGDLLWLFGKGLGYLVRGIARVEDGKIVDLYRYDTSEELEAGRKAWVEQRRVEMAEQWELSKNQFYAGVRQLSSEFQKRIEWFMRRDGWGAEFGAYELFCCKEVSIIALSL